VELFRTTSHQPSAISHQRIMTDPLPTHFSDIALVRALRRQHVGDWMTGTDRRLPALALFALFLVPFGVIAGVVDPSTMNQLGRYCCLAVAAIG
jgi:hypothetical protein